LCGSHEARPYISAQDDLTGKPGHFQFVRCVTCGLVYQNPRLTIHRILDFYDDNYIAHRQRHWGPLTPLFESAMRRLDSRKLRIVRRALTLGPSSRVLDVGCGAGTFLERVHQESGATVTGVDFKDLSALPSLAHAVFRC